MNTERAWDAQRIRGSKGAGRFACVTAYDYATAKAVDAAGIPLILVGDSLGMTVLGYETTLPVTMAEMLHHTAAVARGAGRALVVADMPFLSYQVSTVQAIENAGRFLKEAGAGAVKIEGGAGRVDLVTALTGNGIPVMGHIGLTPQHIRALGGYKVQGREAGQRERLIEDARALDAAGLFALVIECVPADLAAEITAAVRVPTIGIGAGPGCDAQILVLHDMLGWFEGFHPRFVKRYAEIGRDIRAALETYRLDVENGRYPEERHSYRP